MKSTNVLIACASWATATLCFSAAGAAAHAESQPEPILRVLTYNIHHGEARDGRFDYGRLAKTIARLEPHVVALQEVDKQTERAHGVDQAAELGDRLGMNHVFGNALHFSGGQYGEAILSRFALEGAKAHHLPFAYGNEPRTALEVTVKPGNGLPDFVFVGTHLCHQSGATRLEQTKQLNRLFAGRGDCPVVLAGDLNARSGSEPMRELLGKNWIDACAAASGIDYVLLRKADAWEIVGFEIIDEPIVSDHDPVLVTLRWTGDS